MVPLYPRKHSCRTGAPICGMDTNGQCRMRVHSIYADLRQERCSCELACGSVSTRAISYLNPWVVALISFLNLAWALIRLEVSMQILQVLASSKTSCCVVLAGNTPSSASAVAGHWTSYCQCLSFIDYLQVLRHLLRYQKNIKQPWCQKKIQERPTSDSLFRFKHLEEHPDKSSK